MKVIFLDIDGVLNCEKWYTSPEYMILIKNLDDGNMELRSFYPEAVRILNKITNETGAKIVVSSSWRTGRTVDELKSLLSSVGVTGEVIDKTPVLNFAPCKMYPDYNYSVPRGCEIKTWMEINKGRLGDKISKFKYVILDDDSDMLYWHRHNFIRTDRYEGLSIKDYQKSIKILNQ